MQKCVKNKCNESSLLGKNFQVRLVETIKNATTEN